MRPSVCSLRFAQCATLIALAAAAGIARIEVASHPAADEPLPPTGSLRSEDADLRSHSDGFFRTAMDAIAPWFKVVELEMEYAAEPAASAALFIPRPPSARPPLPHSQIATRSARERWYPFAVGPPARQRTQTPRANGITVPGDSLARSTTENRIASEVSWSSRRALRVDAGWPGFGPRRFPAPSHALRGSTGFHPKLCLSNDARTACAIFAATT